MQAVAQQKEKYYWECPHCHSRFFSEPLTLAVRNGTLVKIHPICTNCFEKCRAGHPFGYGERCNVCGDPRRRFNLIAHRIDPDDPTFGQTGTGNQSYPTSTQEIGGDANAGRYGGTIYFQQITITNNGTVQKLGCYVNISFGGNGPCRYAIYSDNANAPYSPLGTCPSTSSSGTGWLDITLSVYVFAAASGKYWLAVECQTTNYPALDYNTGSGYEKAWTYTDPWPDPVTGLTSDSYVIHMHITYVQIKNYAKATKATLSEVAGVLVSVSFYAWDNGNVILGIYYDSSGPSTLLWQAPGVGCSAPAWTTVLISSGTPQNIYNLPVGTYWPAWQWDAVTSGPGYISGGSSGDGNYIVQAFAAFPITWTGGTSTAEKWAEYVTYAAGEPINVSDSAVGSDVVTSIVETLNVTDGAVGTVTAYLLGELLIDGLRIDHGMKITVSEPTVMASRPVSQGLPKRIYGGKEGRVVDIDGWVDNISDLNTITALSDGKVHVIQLPTGTRISVHIIQAQPTRQTAPFQEYPYTIHALERMD